MSTDFFPPDLSVISQFNFCHEIQLANCASPGNSKILPLSTKFDGYCETSIVGVRIQIKRESARRVEPIVVNSAPIIGGGRNESVMTFKKFLETVTGNVFDGNSQMFFKRL